MHANKMFPFAYGLTIVLIAGDYATAGLLQPSQTFIAPNGRNDAYSFGLAAAATASSVFIGEPFVAGGQAESGFVHQYDRATGAYQRTINAPTPIRPFAAFGATLSTRGNELLVGPYGTGQLATYDTTASPSQPLSTPTRQIDSQSGPITVGNGTATYWGDRIVVSSPSDDTLGNDSGAILVYDTQGNATRFYSPSPTNAGPNYLGGQFGHVVVTDGDRLVVSESLADSGPGATITGAVHILDSAGAPVGNPITSPRGTQSNDAFGHSLAVFDGKLAVGSPWATDAQTGARVGAVDIYDATSGQHLRTITNPAPGATNDFGTSIAASNGELIVGGTASNSAYMINPNTGRLVTTITTPNPVPGSDLPGSTFNSSIYKQFGTSITALGNGVLIGEGGIGPSLGIPTDLVRSGTAYLYSAVPPAVPLSHSLLSLPADSSQLVFITHGWLAGGSPDSVTEWVEKLADDILSTSASEPGTLAVVPYSWTNDAKDIEGITTRARDHGLVEGNAIGTRHYAAVHLIGHSASAALIQAAADEIKRVSPETIVHTTFLDSYVPLPGSAYAPNPADAARFGESSDWTDNYFVRDPTGPATQLSFPHAFNLDITATAPSLLTGHSWPHEWYDRSVLAIQSSAQPETLGVTAAGWRFSQEAGLLPEWPSDAPSPRLGKIDSSGRIIYRDLPNYRFVDTQYEALAFSNLTPIFDGNVSVSDSSVSLTTASPAWLSAGIPDLGISNYVMIDISFANSGGNGMLGLYLDDELIGSLNEQFTSPGPHTYFFSFGERNLFDHSLSMRIDPYGTTSSTGIISDVRFGLTTAITSSVPEPSTLTLVGIAVVLLLSRCRPPRARGIYGPID